MNQLGAAHETPRTRASLDDVSSSEPGLGLVGLFEPAAACFAAAGRPRARERIAVSFAADGRVDAARIVGDVPADLRRCVEGALLQSRSICPTTPPAGLQADLVVYTLSP